jgi:hypothetical protein
MELVDRGEIIDRYGVYGFAERGQAGTYRSVLQLGARLCRSARDTFDCVRAMTGFAPNIKVNSTACTTSLHHNASFSTAANANPRPLQATG